MHLILDRGLITHSADSVTDFFANKPTGLKERTPHLNCVIIDRSLRIVVNLSFEASLEHNVFSKFLGHLYTFMATFA